MAIFLALIIFAQLAYVVYLVSSAFRTLFTRRAIERVDVTILVLQLAIAYCGGIAIEMLRSAGVDTISPLIDSAWQTMMFFLLAAIGILLFAKLVGVRGVDKAERK